MFRVSFKRLLEWVSSGVKTVSKRCHCGGFRVFPAVCQLPIKLRTLTDSQKKICSISAANFAMFVRRPFWHHRTASSYGIIAPPMPRGFASYWMACRWSNHLQPLGHRQNDVTNAADMQLIKRRLVIYAKIWSSRQFHNVSYTPANGDRRQIVFVGKSLQKERSAPN